jgi:hypothetical protein
MARKRLTRIPKSIVGAVYDRAYFVDSGKTRGHRPRLQMLLHVFCNTLEEGCREATSDGADGMVRHGETFRLADHPVCAAKVASRLFLNAAATPPVSEGELRASIPFANMPSVET